MLLKDNLLGMHSGRAAASVIVAIVCPGQLVLGLDMYVRVRARVTVKKYFRVRVRARATHVSRRNMVRLRSHSIVARE